MPPAGYPAFLQYLQSGRVRKVLPMADSPPILHWELEPLGRLSGRIETMQGEHQGLWN